MPIASRLAKYPTLQFKLDPENDWDEELIAEISEIATVRRPRSQGPLPRHPGRRRDRPRALPQAVAEAFPDAYLEDPDMNDETRPVLEPLATGSPGTRRSTRSPTSSELERKPKAINSKPSRFGSLEELLAVYEYCEREGIAVYGGGQGELGVGRGQIQYLASLFHPDTPNDVRALGLQRPERPGRPADEPAGAQAGRRRLPLGRVSREQRREAW